MAEAKRRLVLLYQGGKEGRGAWFDIAHKAAVTEAARQPHHVVIELDQVQLDQINPDIPAGTLTSDGRPHPLPVMLGVTFQRLVELAKGPPQAKVDSAAVAPAAATPAKGSVPTPWSEIVVGSVVLASVDREDGWWECVVTGLEGGGLLRMRWRDFPGWDEFRRPASHVGLMPYSGQR